MSINLTNDTGCFTHYLTSNIEALYKIATDNKTTKEKFVDHILQLIEPASYNKDAKPRFINDIRHCKTKGAILDRCFSAISNAVEYQV